MRLLVDECVDERLRHLLAIYDAKLQDLQDSRV
jgi:hypothetical protein